MSENAKNVDSIKYLELIGKCDNIFVKKLQVGKPNHSFGLLLLTPALSKTDEMVENNDNNGNNKIAKAGKPLSRASQPFFAFGQIWIHELHL